MSKLPELIFNISREGKIGYSFSETEFSDDLMEKIRTKGQEFGATTGRPRSCGWFDAILVKRSIMINVIKDS